jgi:hypothetical protein
MKKSLFLIAFIANGFFSMNAQVGIGTPTPDNSAVLDLASTTKGLLPPRMTQTDRDAIALPAKGLIIYNTTTKSLDINNGTPEIKAWEAIASSSTGSSTTYFTVNAGNDTSTMATSDEVVSAMSITPGAGTYAVSFNGQYNSAPFNYDINMTQQALVDLQATYNLLNNPLEFPETHPGHGGTYGNGEELGEGVRIVNSLGTLSGTLTLNANGNPNALFIFKFDAALTSIAGATVILTGAASACNVFWIAENAISLGADTKMKGTLISRNGAVSMAAGSILEGRMFSIDGAVTLGPATVTKPQNCNLIDIGILDSFALFTSKGAVTNAAVSTITGDIGSNEGLISGFDSSSVDGKTYVPSSPLVNIDKNVLSTFSIFQNNVLVENSSRTRRSKSPTIDISLQAIATVAAGEAIDIRWKTDVSQLKMSKRIMTLIKVQ